MKRKTNRNPLTEISRYKNSKNLVQVMELDPREEKRELIEEVIERAAMVIRKTSNRIIRDLILEKSNLNIIYSTVT